MGPYIAPDTRHVEAELAMIYCRGASEIHVKNHAQFIVGVTERIRKTKIDKIIPVGKYLPEFVGISIDCIFLFLRFLTFTKT